MYIFYSKISQDYFRRHCVKYCVIKCRLAKFLFAGWSYVLGWLQATPDKSGALGEKSLFLPGADTGFFQGAETGTGLRT